MNCDVMSEMLSAYVDEELEEPERLKVQSHIDGCMACQVLVMDFMELSGQLSGIYENEFPSAALGHQILQRIDLLHTREQSGILAWIIAICTSFMTFLTVATLLLSPFGMFTWKAVNVSSRFGRGLYTVLLHMMSGKQMVILDAVVIGLAVSIAAFWMMSKLIRNTNLHQFGQTI